mgnify:FL=1
MKDTMSENRAFMEMMKVAKEWLTGRKPLEIAEKTGISYDQRTEKFHLVSMGTDIYIHYPDYEIVPYVNEWQQLIILHYMNLATGAPLEKTWISMREMKDGMIRGGDFDMRCENVICQKLSQVTPEDFSEKCKRIGGKIIKGKADLTVQFAFLPYYPILLKMWFADDEFLASGRLLVDAKADQYLTIEDAVTVGQIVMEKLAGMD